MPSAPGDWLTAGPSHLVDAEVLNRELHDAWLDFGSARLADGQLWLSGDRDFAVAADGAVRRGRFRWQLTITGVSSFEIDDPDGLAGIVVCSVDQAADTLVFEGCTPGHLVVHGFSEARLEVSPHRLPRRRTGKDYVSPPPERSALVGEVERVVRRTLGRFGGEAAAEVTTTWSPRAGMWFVEVEPERSGAAGVSIGIMGDEFVLSLPNSHWEIWRSKRGPDPLVLLGADIEAVFAGRVEEGGWGNDRPVRLTLADGRTRSLGAMRLPFPWRWRRRTAYESYNGERETPT